MPITVRNNIRAPGTGYSPVFRGPVDHTDQIRVTPATGFTAAEIDADGYLKPGLPLTTAGALLVPPATGAPAPFVYGVTIEPVKVARSNAAADLAAAPPVDLAVATVAQVNLDLAEDQLGRAYTATELAGFDVAGSKLVLVR